jgi:hypothetical protein
MAKWWLPESGPWEKRVEAKLFGPPLPKGSSRLEQLRFVRRISARGMLFYVPILALVVVTGASEWETIAICVVLFGSSANLLWMTLKIRSGERAEREAR